MDIKGIALYLALSFVLMYVLTFVLLFEGAITFQSPNLFQYLAQVALMGIPAVAAMAAAFIHTHGAPIAPPALWPLPRRDALRAIFVPAALFAIAYAVATLLGLTYPQWNLAAAISAVEGVSAEPLPDHVRAIAPAVIYVSYPAITILLGATLFAAIALGSEYGWRACLLPRLMPLGALPAYGLTGLCWGAWFFPLIYGWHREAGDFGGLAETQLRCVALAVALSIILGQIYNRTRHLGLCALALGSFTGQACGLWNYLFQQAAPPWTGPLGWIMIAVLAVSAALPGLWCSDRKDSDREDSDYHPAAPQD